MFCVVSFTVACDIFTISLSTSCADAGTIMVAKRPNVMIYFFMSSIFVRDDFL